MVHFSEHVNVVASVPCGGATRVVIDAACSFFFNFFDGCRFGDPG